MKTPAKDGFTILELLVAATLILTICGIVFSVLDRTIDVWTRANNKMDAFQSARASFEIITTRASQATLNVYWDYYDGSGVPFRRAADPGTFVPARYGRYSDLHFVTGQAANLIPALPPHCSEVSTQAVFFAAPTGLTATSSYESMSQLLNASGYFVGFGSDQANRPDIVTTTPSYRWRLLELSSPTESLAVFSSASGTSWFTNPIAEGEVRAIAENVIALVAWPKRTSETPGTEIAPNYEYDSRTTAAWSGTPLAQPVQASQLPPALQVAMVVIDESSAKRMEKGTAAPAQITEALDGLLKGPAADYDDHIGQLETRLTDRGITHRIFTSTISLRESSWSE